MEISKPVTPGDGVNGATAPEVYKTVLFADAYNLVPSPSGSGSSSARPSETNHPVETTSISLDQTGLYTKAGEALGGAIGALGGVAEGLFSSKAPAEASNSKSTERDQVLTKVGPIPDVQRPSLAASGQNNSSEQSKKLDDDYAASLAKLKELPATYTASGGQDMQSIAKQIVDSRTAITGEQPTADSYAQEAKRLAELNPGAQVKDGTQLKVYTDDDMKSLAQTIEYKYVPQLGQFLKQNGISEAQIDKALQVQQSEPQESKELIGQILIDQGLATKDQVNAAFASQNQLKDELSAVRTSAGL